VEWYFIERTELEFHLEGGMAGRQVIVVMVVNGYAPASTFFSNSEDGDIPLDPEPNVDGVDAGMFLAISASEPISVTVE
jgi:hypothetical protein